MKKPKNLNPAELSHFFAKATLATVHKFIIANPIHTMEAIKKKPVLITLLKDPTNEMLELAITMRPRLVKVFKGPSADLIKLAVFKEPYLISNNLPQYSEEIILAAILGALAKPDISIYRLFEEMLFFEQLNKYQISSKCLQIMYSAVRKETDPVWKSLLVKIKKSPQWQDDASLVLSELEAAKNS